MTPEAKIHYANLNVPRYTSYPTAPQFSANVTPEEVTAWLGRLAPDEPVSLYLHVPYCRQICLYCGCNTKATRQDSPLEDYADGLVAEIRLLATAIGRRQVVSHIHWGGGTPSLLPRKAFLNVFQEIDTRFQIASNVEHAIELDPRSVTAELAATLKEAGVTRVSLGIQDFEPRVQEAIGRVQPVATVAEAVKHLRAVGLDAINFDLMYGLPHQTMAGLTATIGAAAELDPSRIALFGYAHVPWFKKHQRLIDVATLPGTHERLALEAAARAALLRHDYRPVGLDHFAKPTDSLVIAADAHALHRNFQGYTTDTATTLIGIGTSSISRLPEGYAQNAADVSHWRQSIAAGRLPVVKGKVFSADDCLRAEIIERLMCDYSVDLDAVCRTHGSTLDEIVGSLDQVQDLVADGLVAIDRDSVVMTKAGRPFVRVVAAAFDAYLRANAPRHSAAV